MYAPFFPAKVNQRSEPNAEMEESEFRYAVSDDDKLIGHSVGIYEV